LTFICCSLYQPCCDLKSSLARGVSPDLSAFLAPILAKDSDAKCVARLMLSSLSSANASRFEVRLPAGKESDCGHRSRLFAMRRVR
jgi:hypothetical protein